MEKLVSVVIPTCNDGIYLESAINSILVQTYGNIEIIVVDSSDDLITLDILKKYENDIRCFRQPRKGVAAALNFGLSQIKGEYVARMDADDISLPQRISRQVDFMESNERIGVLGTQCDIIDEYGRIIGCYNSECFSDSEIKSKLIFENCIIHPSVMMRADFFKCGWRYDEAHYAEDIRLWMQMACRGIEFANLNERLLLYRRRKESMSSYSDKVAHSVARSAKEYAEAMFDLEIDKYEAEDFMRQYYNRFIKKSKAEYLVKQLELLNDIYSGNKKTKMIDCEQLAEELNKRWNWVYGRYGKSITYMYEKKFLCPDVKKSFFFLQEIMRKLHILNDEEVIGLLNELMVISERFTKQQRLKHKIFAIYGMGKKGKELITEYEKKYISGEINWELIAIADAKKLEAVCCGKNMTTISQSQLIELNPDIVIISSDKYYEEILLELEEKNIKSKIMDSSWII